MKTGRRGIDKQVSREMEGEWRGRCGVKNLNSHYINVWNCKRVKFIFFNSWAGSLILNMVIFRDGGTWEVECMATGQAVVLRIIAVLTEPQLDPERMGSYKKIEMAPSLLVFCLLCDVFFVFSCHYSSAL